MNEKTLLALIKLAKEWDVDATRLNIAANNKGYGRTERAAYRATASKIQTMTEQLRTILKIP